MCLEIRSKNSDRLNKKFKNGRVILYKVVNRIDKVLYTPFQSFLVGSGFLEAIRPLTKDDVSKMSTIFSGSIHVHTNKKSALASVNDCLDGIELVIPVICYKKDFLAVGHNEDACFTKVFIRKKDYEKALKAKSKYAVVGK